MFNIIENQSLICSVGFQIHASFLVEAENLYLTSLVKGIYDFIFRLQHLLV